MTAPSHVVGLVRRLIIGTLIVLQAVTTALSTDRRALARLAAAVAIILAREVPLISPMHILQSD